ncbi:MAG: hypothetical protein LBH05_07260 [Deferribacteraceae bacterium]|jgi:hypothetical protein|nr:hypothetical protein [Deferribacteraceae bacterium]
MNSIKTVFNVFTLLMGRIPVWALFTAFFTKKGFTFGAFAAFLFAAAIAKGFLYAYEYNKGQIFSVIYSLWRIIARPALMVVLAAITFFGLQYAIFAGTQTDFIIILSAFACFIISYALGIFIKKPVPQTRNVLLKRQFPFNLVITLLWIYAIFQPDGETAALCALLLICVFEYTSVYEIFPEEQVL